MSAQDLLHPFSCLALLFLFLGLPPFIFALGLQLQSLAYNHKVDGEVHKDGSQREGNATKAHFDASLCWFYKIGKADQVVLYHELKGFVVQFHSPSKLTVVEAL